MKACAETFRECVFSENIYIYLHIYIIHGNEKIYLCMALTKALSRNMKKNKIFLLSTV